tara:strand:- start:833 stop:1111 length:279 start_codon:yes stop_codon:yes gene_type:complete
MVNRNPVYDLKIGDLVRITDRAIEFEIIKNRPNIGVVVSEPYCYMTTECEGPDIDAAMIELEHWCYDILFGNEITRMMPEEFIEPLNVPGEK